MKYAKFNKYQKKEINIQKREKALSGFGIYVYRNNTKADLSLPKPTANGVKVVGRGKEFQGDDYYLSLVKSGELKLVKIIQNAMEAKMSNDKLILDQPDTIKEHGKVEHEVVNPMKKLNETEKNTQEDVLLVEQPISNSFEILG